MKKNVVFNLQKFQLDAIEKLKSLITSALILNIFDPNLPTRLKIDTSSEELGALLEQNHGLLENPQWHTIKYSSGTLRDYEKRYAQIEKDTFSIVFGAECCHEYLYGRKFTVINEHKPVKSIFSRSIATCPPRIQKFFGRLQKRDFELEYAPDKTTLVSDTLSRSYLNDIKPEFDKNT